MHEPVFGLILAGGAARRLGGGDKPLTKVGGRTMLERIAARLGPQCTGLGLNANGPESFEGAGLPIIPDDLPDRPGPLAGLLAGLDYCATHRPDVGRLASVPGDAPFIPDDLVARLDAAKRMAGATLAIAASGGRTHWPIGLWPVSIRHELRQAITQDGLRRVEAFVQRFGHAEASWEAPAYDPFFNVNTPEDLAEAERLARSFAL